MVVMRSGVGLAVGADGVEGHIWMRRETDIEKVGKGIVTKCTIRF